MPNRKRICNSCSKPQSSSTLPISLLLLILLFQSSILHTVSASRDLLLNAPMAKDSLFLSQPSRDWAPGGKLAEQARRKHNQRAAFLRNSANSAGIPLNVNTDSNEANANTVTSNDGQMDGSADGTGSGSGLEEKIRDAMKLHFNQNGMASNSTRKGSSDLEHEKSSVKLEGLAGKSEDRILTSGQRDKADKDARRIAQLENPTSNQIKGQTSPQEDISQTQTQRKGTVKDEDQKPLLSSEILESKFGHEDGDETWERSNLMFSDSRGKGRSGRRYVTVGGNILQSLRKLGGDEDEVEKVNVNDATQTEIYRSTENPNDVEGKSKQEKPTDGKVEKVVNDENEKLKIKAKESALKQAENAALDAEFEEKEFTDRGNEATIV